MHVDVETISPCAKSSTTVSFNSAGINTFASSEPLAILLIEARFHVGLPTCTCSTRFCQIPGDRVTSKVSMRAQFQLPVFTGARLTQVADLR